MLNGPKLKGFTGRGKGQCYQICSDKVKVPRTDEKHCHTLIEDPQKIMTVMILSPSLPQVDAFGKNKCDICQQDKKCLRRTREQDQENLRVKTRQPSGVLHYKRQPRF